MTDQSNTPKPPSGSPPAGKSLFERAGDAFDLKGFQPAPVPAGLDPEPLRQKRVRPQTQTVAPVTPQPASPAPALVPAAVSAAVPVVEQPVTFDGEPHHVDREALREQGFILPDGAVTALLEEFRIVKRKLLQAARESLAGRGAPNGQRVLVCSPHPGEGKTFCATNLALAIAAEKDSEVLLVDADFAKPAILEVLGLPEGPGLMDALADPEARVEDFVIATDIQGFYILPAGNRSNADSEYLASTRTVEVLDRLTRGAPNRILIFDSPPALAASPAAELAKYVGQVLLVARADSTGRSALEDAVSLLSHCPDIKLLLNAARFSPSGRRFGAYHGREG